MPELQIYLARNNQQAGPFTLEQVNDMLASQSVLLTDLMWHVGMPEWKSIGEMTQGRNYYQPYPNSNHELFSPSETASSLSSENHSPITKKASVGKRIIAKLIDWSILFIPQLILYSFFINAEIINKLTTATTTAEQNKIMLEFAQTLPNWVSFGVLGYTLFILFIQNDLIKRSGQSIGKKILKLKIVDIETNQIVASSRAFFKRSFIFFMIFQLAQLFPLLLIILLVDFVLLFSKQNLTLHDRFSKTKVVDIAQ